MYPWRFYPGGSTGLGKGSPRAAGHSPSGPIGRGHDFVAGPTNDSCSPHLLEGEVEVSKALVMRMSRQEVDQTDKSLLQLSSDPHPEFGKPAFGEMALFSETCKRSATVTTTRPSVLGVIQHCRFIELCETDHEIGYRGFLNIAE